MFTRHKFDPPICDNMLVDNTTCIDNGKVLYSYAINCTTNEQLKAVSEYYGTNMGTMDKRSEVCVGMWIYNGSPKRIRIEKENLFDNEKFLRSHTPIVEFDEFERLKDQEEFDVLDFISSLG